MNLIKNLGGSSGFGEQYLVRGDDSNYVSNIDIRPWFGANGLNFFGTNYTAISINNNGNITFGPSGLSSYTPWGMQQSNSVPMIAAYFADVDTRGYSNNVLGPGAVTATTGGTSTGSNLTWYDFNNSGYGTLTVTWDDVGYYPTQTDKLNAFQLRLIGTGGGGFDIEFRYETINWTTGSASGGSGGLGGTVARAGFTAGDGTNYYELLQSGIQDQMLSLEDTPGNTGQEGYYRFTASSGLNTDDVLYGDEDNNIISGGGGKDRIYGMGGNDQLDGGSGADTLYGGSGNDRFIVRDTTDVIRELSGDGIDTVQTAMSYSLATVNNVENIILTGADSVNATGNSLDNLLVSNLGANQLAGGAGSDTASFELSTASVTASLITNTASGNGADTLISIENLTGSVFADILTGNDDDNILNGLNGLDTLTGKNGDDIYIVDNFGDEVVEVISNGYDSVRSSVSYTLSTNVEALFLTGASRINGTGNSLSNYMAGNKGNNILTGNKGEDRLFGLEGNDTLRGGSGKDLLSGGSGSDTFDFNSLNELGLANSQRDVISDFKAQEKDKIDLSSIDAQIDVAGHQTFSFVSTFTSTAGQVRFSDGVLYFNIDSDTAAEYAINLTGVTTLSASSLIL